MNNPYNARRNGVNTSDSLLDDSVFDTSNGDKLLKILKSKRNRPQPLFAKTQKQSNDEKFFLLNDSALIPKKSVNNIDTVENSTKSSEKITPSFKIPSVPLKSSLRRRALIKEIEKQQQSSATDYSKFDIPAIVTSTPIPANHFLDKNNTQNKQADQKISNNNVNENCLPTTTNVLPEDISISSNTNVTNKKSRRSKDKSPLESNKTNNNNKTMIFTPIRTTINEVNHEVTVDSPKKVKNVWPIILVKKLDTKKLLVSIESPQLLENKDHDKDQSRKANKANDQCNKLLIKNVCTDHNNKVDNEETFVHNRSDVNSQNNQKDVVHNTIIPQKILENMKLLMGDSGIKKPLPIHSIKKINKKRNQKSIKKPSPVKISFLSEKLSSGDFSKRKLYSTYMQNDQNEMNVTENIIQNENNIDNNNTKRKSNENENESLSIKELRNESIKQKPIKTKPQKSIATKPQKPIKTKPQKSTTKPLKKKEPLLPVNTNENNVINDEETKELRRSNRKRCLPTMYWKNNAPPRTTIISYKENNLIEIVKPKKNKRHTKNKITDVIVEDFREMLSSNHNYNKSIKDSINENKINNKTMKNKMNTESAMNKSASKSINVLKMAPEMNNHTYNAIRNAENDEITMDDNVQQSINLENSATYTEHTSTVESKKLKNSHLPIASTSTTSKVKKLKSQLRKDNKIVNNKDSGNDSLSIVNNINFWIQDMVDPKKHVIIPGSTNRNSDVSFNDGLCSRMRKIVFCETDGIGFSAYSIHKECKDGYLRFQPLARKKLSISQKFNLRFLIMAGEFHFIVDKQFYILHDGDYLVIPKGAHYEVLNNSSKSVGLLFYSKT